jgi:hypothetical protein
MGMAEDPEGGIACPADLLAPNNFRKWKDKWHVPVLSNCMNQQLRQKTGMAVLGMHAPSPSAIWALRTLHPSALPAMLPLFFWALVLSIVHLTLSMLSEIPDSGMPIMPTSQGRSTMSRVQSRFMIRSYSIKFFSRGAALPENLRRSACDSRRQGVYKDCLDVRPCSKS